MKSAAVFLALLVSTLAEPQYYDNQPHNYHLTSTSSYDNQYMQQRIDHGGLNPSQRIDHGGLNPSQRIDHGGVNPSQRIDHGGLNPPPRIDHGGLNPPPRIDYGGLNPPPRIDHGGLNPQPRIDYGGLDPSQRIDPKDSEHGYQPQYGVRSSLRDLTTRLQQDIERELQVAVYNQYQSSGAYGGATATQIQADKRLLQDELRRNLTVKLGDALKSRYGLQAVRNGYSYSIVNGRLQSVANYETRELQELTSQLETTLLRYLEQQIQTYYRPRAETYTPRPVPSYPTPRPVPSYPTYPRPAPPPVTPRVTEADKITDHVGGNYGTRSNLREVISRAQQELEWELPKAVYNHHSRTAASYGGNIPQSQVQTDKTILENELRRNITKKLDDSLKARYGAQGIRNGYSYSITNGRFQSVPNYEDRELQELVRQLEVDLLRQLDQQVQTNYRSYNNYNPAPVIRPQPQPWTPRPVTPTPVVRVPPRYRQAEVRPKEDSYGQYPSGDRVYDQHQLPDLERTILNLEPELERQLGAAVKDHHRKTVTFYGNALSQAQIQTDKRILEDELKRNMTARIQEALNARYGHQTVRDGLSYSVINGRMANQANYDIWEVDEWSKELETTLSRSLEEQVQRYYQVRVAPNNFPGEIRQAPTYRPTPPPRTYAASDSITTIATRVQTELNENLDKILDRTRREYFSGNGHNSGVNYDSILAQLQNDLKMNITSRLDEEVKRSYGHASQYDLEHKENLRRQIETNLVAKLNRDFNRQKEQALETRQPTHPTYQPPRPIPDNYAPPRPIPDNYAPPRPSPRPIPDNYTPPHPNPRPIPDNYAYYPYPQPDIAQTQQRLKEQLSRQLQATIGRESYLHRYGNPYVNPDSNYQATLRELSDEVNRNLTQEIEMLKSQQYRSGAYDTQLASMKSQLQTDLMRELQQGLQRAFSKYSTNRSESTVQYEAAPYRTHYRDAQTYHV